MPEEVPPTADRLERLRTEPALADAGRTNHDDDGRPLPFVCEDRELFGSADEPVHPRGLRQNFDHGRPHPNLRGRHIEEPGLADLTQYAEEADPSVHPLQDFADGHLLKTRVIAYADRLLREIAAQTQCGRVPRLREFVDFLPLSAPLHVGHPLADESVADHRPEILDRVAGMKPGRGRDPPLSEGGWGSKLGRFPPPVEEM